MLFNTKYIKYRTVIFHYVGDTAVWFRKWLWTNYETSKEKCNIQVIFLNTFLLVKGKLIVIIVNL